MVHLPALVMPDEQLMCYSSNGRFGVASGADMISGTFGIRPGKYGMGSGTLGIRSDNAFGIKSDTSGIGSGAFGIMSGTFGIR